MSLSYPPEFWRFYCVTVHCQIRVLLIIQSTINELSNVTIRKTDGLAFLNFKCTIDRKRSWAKNALWVNIRMKMYW